jgi:hypothetical protein
MKYKMKSHDAYGKAVNWYKKKERSNPLPASPDADDVVWVERLPVTSPVRTVVDLAGVLDDAGLEAVVRLARARRLVTVRALRSRSDEIGAVGRPAAARLRRLLTTIGSGRVEPSARMAG